MDSQGRHIYLRHCNEQDILPLFQWRNDNDFRKNCSVRRDETNLDDFREELKEDFKRDRHIQMMIIRKKDGKPIGTIYSYGYKKVDGYAFITIFLSEPYRTSGYGAEAIALFLYHLFSEFPIFKIYMEVYEYNTQSLSCIRGARFAEEGRFIKHRLFNDIRYDLLRFAVYRDKNLQQIERFLRRLKRSA